jgi:hypothetical protein
LVIVAVALWLPSSAAAAAGCAHAVVQDWSDGRIDNQYPIACYRAALKDLPEDLRVYGSAESDIRRALASATTKKAAATPVRTASARANTASTPWLWWLAIGATVFGIAMPAAGALLRR